MDPYGKCKIADFGLSKRTDEENPLQEKTTNIGTPVYMAPELMVDSRSAQYDGALVDVYSFGILMWAVLAKEMPYESMLRAKEVNIWGLRDMIVNNGTRPDLEGENAPMHLQLAPSSVIRLMEQCWRHDAQDRPKSFTEIRNRLRRIHDQITGVSGRHVRANTAYGRDDGGERVSVGSESIYGSGESFYGGYGGAYSPSERETDTPSPPAGLSATASTTNMFAIQEEIFHENPMQRSAVNLRAGRESNQSRAGRESNLSKTGRGGSLRQLGSKRFTGASQTSGSSSNNNNSSFTSLGKRTTGGSSMYGRFSSATKPHRGLSAMSELEGSRGSTKDQRSNSTTSTVSITSGVHVTI
jgi:serine/threonine protein kinase